MTLNPILDPFTKALDADLTAAADLPPGYRAATGPEVGVHAPPELDHLNHRKIWMKPTDDSAGRMAWEQSLAPEVKHARRFKEACRNAVWAVRLDPDKGEGKALFKQYHEQGKPLPRDLQAELDAPEVIPKELTEAMRKMGPMPSYSSTTMAGTQAEKVSGVRLEKPDFSKRKITR